MGRPQQPELARSAKTDLDPDHVETGLQGQKAPPAGGETGPVPAENQPGHHPPEEQDKPDLEAFAAKLGANPKAPKSTTPKAAKARKVPAPRKASTAEAAGGPPKRPSPVLATGAEEAARISAPQPEPEEQGESRLVSVALLPLRETVKRLDQLERSLTKRLRGGRGPRGR